MHPVRRTGCALTARPHLDVTERRARLVLRHRIAPATRARDPVTVARSLVALHATDALTVFLSVLARTEGVTRTDVERSFYDDRTIVRHLGMRRTLFALPRESLPLVHASSTQAIAVRERRKLESLVRDAGIAPDPVQWLADV